MRCRFLPNFKEGTGMTRIHGFLIGAVAGAAWLVIGGMAYAQDATDPDPSSMPQAGGMGSQPTAQYCVPGCIVGPMTDGNMQHGMMGQGMMSQGTMPMMMAPGMMGQGMMPMMMPNMMYQMPMMGGGMTMGPGMMGQGMMPMMTPNMMYQMPMPGGGMMMAPGMMDQGTMPMTGMVVATPLAPDSVRPHLEHHLAMMGLPNLVLGSIDVQDDDTLVAEIVTRDGTLVQRLAIDRHTGAVTPLEE